MKSPEYNSDGPSCFLSLNSWGDAPRGVIGISTVGQIPGQEVVAMVGHAATGAGTGIEAGQEPRFGVDSDFSAFFRQHDSRPRARARSDWRY